MRVLRRLTFLTILFICSTPLLANSDSLLLISINQEIDNAVVKQELSRLQQYYATDFVFSHGSGRVEGKEGWLSSVKKGNFLERKHDSVTVELHPGLAIVKGKLGVTKRNNTGSTDKYYLYYLRVYARRESTWQLISHNTTAEFHQ